MALKLTAVFLLFAAFDINLIDAIRSDYFYIASTQSYYKHYKARVQWAVAKANCQSEGSVLFHPDTEAELREVLSGLDLSGGWGLHSGLSDLKTFKEYVTVDGRPISKVFNKWGPGHPRSCSNNECRCGCIDVRSYTLLVDPCDWAGPYICKFSPTQTEAVTAIEEIKSIMVNTSEKFAGLMEQQVINQTTAFEAFERHAEILELQLANQTASMRHLAGSMRLQAANQTAAFEAFERHAETMALQSASQTAALEQLAKTMQEQEANKAAVLERQTLALEKLAGSFPAYTAALSMLAKDRNNDNNDKDGSRYSAFKNVFFL